ncbi:hypothetical protein [Nocardia sp. NPDC057668]|uniref:hypothetical protein n=1 Tax=Nocardia sp. NPDC057668 TaxID=3346202 RepID=UPI0036732F46
MWTARLDNTDPGRLRQLNGQLREAHLKRKAAISARKQPFPNRFRWPITLAVFTALAGWAVLVSQLGDIPLLLLLPAVCGTSEISRQISLRFPRSLVLSKSEALLVEEATRSIPISDKDRAITLLKHQRSPRNAADLIAVASYLAELITGSDAWTSPYLEPHRAQFDVNEEVRQIATNAARYEVMLQRVDVAPTGSTPTAELAKSAQNIARQQLDVVWKTLRKRVAALIDFASHIKQLDTELHNAALARQALDMDDELADLMASAAANELATGQLRHLSDQTAGLTLAIRELVEHLHNDLTTLRALAPRDRPRDTMPGSGFDPA